MAHTIGNIALATIGIGLDGAAAASNVGARSGPATDGPASVTSASTDRATLSSLGGLLSSSVQNAGALSSFRADHVAALKTAIANGSYMPDFGKVAQRVSQALKGVAQ